MRKLLGGAVVVLTLVFSSSPAWASLANVNTNNTVHPNNVRVNVDIRP